MTSSPLPLLLLPLLFLFLLSLPLSSAAPPSQSLLNAAETLSSSGFNAMSLTLSLLLSDSSLSLQINNNNSNSHPTLTIFTPPDSSFVNSGQPSLSKLLSHFSPLSLPLPSLKSLPLNSKIPSLSPSPSSPLFLTSTSPALSINNITISPSPLFDDGYIIIFAIDDFFPPNFTIQNSPKITSPECSVISPFSMLLDASTRMKARGYSIMASFLEIQLIGYLKIERDGGWPLKMTMFAPEDEVLVKVVGDVGGYSGLFVRHVLPCKLSFGDLGGMANGTVFEEYFEGVSVRIERSEGNEVFVNGVRVTFPEIYESDWLVVHGVSDVISEGSEGSEGVVGDEVMEVENDEVASGPDGNEL